MTAGAPNNSGRLARVVRFSEVGGPEVLKLVEELVPPPGPDQVQIDVRAFGLNRAETVFRRGQYIEKPEFPARLGYEATGTIAALGEGVTGLSIGDAVSLIPPATVTRWGTWGEVVNVPARYLVKHTTDFAWETMAATWMATGTSYGALIDIAGMKKGDTVLISAASSSVGLNAIQLANAVGACPIALTRTSEKSARLKDAGARHVIACDESDLVGRVNEITDGRGARIAFDPVGGPQVEDLARALCKRGMLIVYGRLDTRPTPFPLLDVISKGLTVRGFMFAEFLGRSDSRQELGEFTLKMLRLGAISPVIDSVFSLDEIAAANLRLESGNQFGKIVVRV